MLNAQVLIKTIRHPHLPDESKHYNLELESSQKKDQFICRKED